MSYSTRKIVSPRTKYLYNKWRLATLICNVVGLMVFLFALSMADLTKPLMVVSVAILWTGVFVARRFQTLQEGKPLAGMARISFWISALLALVLSVLTVITVVH